MTELVARLLPAALLVCAGWLLRRLGLVPQDVARGALRLVFYIFLPALLFVVLARAPLTAGLAVFPAVGVGVNLASLTLTWIAARALGWPKAARGAGLAAGGIMMGAFNFSLMALLYDPAGPGEPAVARGVLIDFGNALFSVTVIFLIARRHGAGQQSLAAGLRALVAAPLLWAVLLGAAVNLLGGPARVPAGLWQAAELAAQAAMPLVFVSVGAFLRLGPVTGLSRDATPRDARASAAMWVPTLVVAGCRVAGGLAAGTVLSFTLGLRGLDRAAVLVMAASPCGSTSLVYCAAFDLDATLAANAISLSVLLDLAAVGLLICTGLVAAPA